jgi:hypothetical protein
MRVSKEREEGGMEVGRLMVGTDGRRGVDKGVACVFVIENEEEEEKDGGRIEEEDEDDDEEKEASEADDRVCVRENGDEKGDCSSAEISSFN